MGNNNLEKINPMQKEENLFYFKILFQQSQTKEDIASMKQEQSAIDKEHTEIKTWYQK